MNWPIDGNEGRDWLPGSQMQCFACVCRPDGDLVRYPIRSPLNSTKERTETVVMILGPPFIGMVMALGTTNTSPQERLSHTGDDI